MFEISAWSKTIHNDSKYVATSLHHFVHMLSVAAEPLIKHIRRNNLASRASVIVSASLHYSLEGELVQNHSSMFILNYEYMTKENGDCDLSQQRSIHLSR